MTRARRYADGAISPLRATRFMAPIPFGPRNVSVRLKRNSEDTELGQPHNQNLLIRTCFLTGTLLGKPHGEQPYGLFQHPGLLASKKRISTL